MDGKAPVRLGRYRARRSGRGYVVTLPQEWIDDNPVEDIILEAYSAGDGTLIFLSKKEAQP